MAVVDGNLELKDIFEKERFPKSNWQFLSLVVYFPFGLLLAILRIFIGFHACFVGLVLTHTPFIRSIVLRMLCLVLGINVEQDNKHERDKSTRVIVSNCVTRFDHIAFHLTTDCVTHKERVSGFPVHFIPGFHDFKQGGGSLMDNLKAHIANNDLPPLFLQPEETTSGKNCLLKFSATPGEMADSVQPVALTVERPTWANTAPTVLGASAPVDLFWFLFSPYTVFKLKYLNVLHREKRESADDFAARLQACIANALAVKASTFSLSDKVEYEKRYLSELRRAVMSSGPFQPPPPELLRMAAQVAEVLPYLPREVILRDLARTRSVDLTISNMLEGSVSLGSAGTSHLPTTSTPPLRETRGRSRSGSRGRASSSSSSSPSSASSSSSSHQQQQQQQQHLSNTFAKSSQDRMSSFQERKAKMIADARRKYIEKKGLLSGGGGVLLSE